MPPSDHASIDKGAHVVLREPFMGYPTGTPGVVTDSDSAGRLRVRFLGNRIALVVGRELAALKPRDAR